MKRIVILMSVCFSVSVLAGEKSRWHRSFTGSLATQHGNTQLTSYSLALSGEYAGDLVIGLPGTAPHMNLKDSEVKFALSHSRGQLNNKLYENEGSASFLLDVMAHQSFSPFFLSFWTYDSTTFLERRIQLGAGGRYSLGKGVSVSVAYLWETEKYSGKAGRRQYRLSARPKYKAKLPNGTTVNYLIFVQPLIPEVRDFLVDSQLTLSVPIFVEKLSFAATWREQYDSQPEGNVKRRDRDVKVGLTYSW